MQNADWSMCDLLFLGRPVGGTPRPMPRALDLLTLGTFRLRLEMCLERTSQPFFVRVDRTGGETTVSVL